MLKRKRKQHRMLRLLLLRLLLLRLLLLLALLLMMYLLLPPHHLMFLAMRLNLLRRSCAGYGPPLGVAHPRVPLQHQTLRLPEAVVVHLLDSPRMGGSSTRPTRMSG